MYTILVIEDDQNLNRGIEFTLTKEGYHILAASNISLGKQLYKNYPIDLILLDLNLPDGDGIGFCQEIRTCSEVPIIMLTARDLETDEVIGFESGADDYITKPFSLAVLKARIQARLKKSLYQDSSGGPSTNWLTSREIRLCKDTCKVFLQDKEIILSGTEYKLLQYFLENKDIVLLKEQILQAIWGIDANFVDENTLSVNIRRLRIKLEEDSSNPQWIKTVHGMGYLWNERNQVNED